MCDSLNAVDPRQVKENAEYLTQKEIADKFLKFYKQGSSRYITLSGGNPCIHDLGELIADLTRYGYRFVVETQGTFAPDWLKQCNLISCSPKGPGMGEDTNLDELDAFISKAAVYTLVAMKVVVFDQRDLEFAKMLFERYAINQGYKFPFFLSLGNPYPPGYMEEYTPKLNEYIMTQIGRYKMLFEDIQCDPILSTMKFLPQWHTFLWGNEKGK
jgi:7-carboxy-7-deazaguanine synthase